MAYLTEEIELKARRLTGSEENDDTLRAFCELAADEAAFRLRTGISPESIKPAFTSAAALLAAADVIEMRDKSGCGLSSFSAGNVSASFAAAKADPKAMRSRAWRMLARYTEGGFSFVGVRG